MNDDVIQHASGTLRRELGVFGATMMGLGAMMGTGVFVSIGVAAGVAGPPVVLAVVIAGLVALGNALSSAQLAASHPVSGGTYEYGYKYLSPSLGFSAGWMFLCAKSASAATAALGFGGYLLHAAGYQHVSPVLVAVPVVLAVTAVVLGGIRRSHVVNVAIVCTTIIALVLFVAFALPAAMDRAGENLRPIFPSGESGWPRFFEGCALMFVAFTGYGRIATMGEEVKSPRRTIPRAIIATLMVSTVLYVAVAVGAVGAYGAADLGQATRAEAAPLETVLKSLGHPAVAAIVAVGAMTAMLGVLLNLILGLSRMVLAMARRKDLPTRLSHINQRADTPSAAVLLVGVALGGLCLLGDVKLTWSFSAFTVLVYYAVTNLAALRMPREARLFPIFFPCMGLVSCLVLAFSVDLRVWLTGLAVLAAGLAWHGLAAWRRRRMAPRGR